MKTTHLLFLAASFGLAACGGPGEAGDECLDDGDCAEGLECHMHEHEGEEEGEHEDEHGVCEAHEDE